MKTPDLTPAQLLSSVLAIAGLLVTQGLITDNMSRLIGGIASIVIPMMWQIADAIIRHGRSKAHAAIRVAELNQTTRTITVAVPTPKKTVRRKAKPKEVKP